jgi:hypothetical protein
MHVTSDSLRYPSNRRGGRRAWLSSTEGLAGETRPRWQSSAQRKKSGATGVTHRSEQSPEKREALRSWTSRGRPVLGCLQNVEPTSWVPRFAPLMKRGLGRAKMHAAALSARQDPGHVARRRWPTQSRGRKASGIERPCDHHLRLHSTALQSSHDAPTSAVFSSRALAILNSKRAVRYWPRASPDAWRFGASATGEPSRSALISGRASPRTADRELAATQA